MNESLPVIQIDFEKGVNLSKEEIQHYITKLEEHMRELPQTEIPLKHYFSKGVYGREIEIPAKSLVVGKIHKYQVMNVVSKGEVSVLSIDGVVRMKAPCTWVSSPGAKRVIYAHEDTVWSNFLGTSETDIKKIEQEFIAATYEDVVKIERQETQRIGEI